MYGYRKIDTIWAVPLGMTHSTVCQFSQRRKAFLLGHLRFTPVVLGHLLSWDSELQSSAILSLPVYLLLLILSAVITSELCTTEIFHS